MSIYLKPYDPELMKSVDEKLEIVKYQIRESMPINNRETVYLVAEATELLINYIRMKEMMSEIEK